MARTGRVAGWIVGGVALVFGIGAIYLYQQVTSLDVVPVTDDVYAITGLGSNVGVLRAGDGVVVVDTMTFRIQGRRIRDAAEALGGPTQALINTHYHLDHTHGNPAWASGMRVVSTERTRRYLRAMDAAYWEGDAAGTLPNETFDEERVLRFGDKTIRLLHPGRGHTDGDLVALFVEDRVLHTGDLFFNGRYPNIDLEAGGSVREWGDTIDRLLALDFELVIPGHGPVTDREGLIAFQRFIRQLSALGEEAARDGLSLQDTLALNGFDADDGYDVMQIPFVMKLDRDFVITRAWQEATGEYERVSLD